MGTYMYRSISFRYPTREEVWGHTCIALFPLGILQGRRCGDIHVSLYFLSRYPIKEEVWGHTCIALFPL